MTGEIRKEFTEAQSAKKREQVLKDPAHPLYHLTGPVGWVNDPNGLCQKDGVNHLFYQYTPQCPDGSGWRGWGHYTTRDWIHYQEEDDPLVPDGLADQGGSYSGSALVEEDTIRFFYTANRKLPGDHDYICSGRIHWTLEFDSPDGEHFTGRKVLLKNRDYPENVSCHVRDPKVWKKDGRYFMVLGARTMNDLGEVLVYESPDLKSWKLKEIISSEKRLGYMWECPDVFEMDETDWMIFCPQGVWEEFETDQDSVCAFGKIRGLYEGNPLLEEVSLLDYGPDFYAPQSFVDESGRRILQGWMGHPETGEQNPTLENGWQHQFAIPRLLSVKNGKLRQELLPELRNLAHDESEIHLEAGKTWQMPTRSMLLDLQMPYGDWKLDFRSGVKIALENGQLSIDLNKHGAGRKKRTFQTGPVSRLQIVSDSSSLEFFINDGEKTFSTRIYDQEADQLQIRCSSPLHGRAWKMNPIQVIWKPEKNREEGRFVPAGLPEGEWNPVPEENDR